MENKTIDYRYAESGEEEQYAKLWEQAEQGDLKAQKKIADSIYIYVQMYPDPTNDCETMIRYYKNLIEHGDADAMFSLGEAYYCGYDGIGLGVRNVEESTRLIKMAADKGCAAAQQWMAEAYYTGCLIDGEPFEGTIDDAPEWLFKLPQKCYISEFIGAYSYDDVVDWYTRAAEKGIADAQCSLGDLYYNGDCVELDCKKARKWYRKAVKHGIAPAQYNLGWMYWTGDGIHADENKAFELFSLSAAQGYLYAQTELGTLYCHGVIVEQDYCKGIDLLKKGAAQGDDRAFKQIAAAYIDWKSDYKEAAKWYKKAAKKGDRFSCLNLGRFYEEGLGVDQDLKKSAQWYRKAHRLKKELINGTFADDSANSDPNCPF